MSSNHKRTSLRWRDLAVDESGGLTPEAWAAAFDISNTERQAGYEQQAGHGADSDAEMEEVELEVESLAGGPSSSQLNLKTGPGRDTRQAEAQSASDRMLAVAKSAARMKERRELEKKVVAARKEAQLKLLAYAQNHGFHYNPFARSSGAAASADVVNLTSKDQAKSPSPPPASPPPPFCAGTVAAVVKAEDSEDQAKPRSPHRTEPRPKPSQAKRLRNNKVSS